MAAREIWAFASGSNSPGKIVGAARAGIGPGVALLRWDGSWKWDCARGTGATPSAMACWAALLRAAKQLRVPVFVDTGAFIEATAGRPIPDKLWHAVLAQQLELARALGPQAVVVLPDKVGDQTTTLRRLRRYKDEVGKILDAGARGIVVLQGGRLGDVEMATEVARVLGRTDWILGFPTVRARREPAEIAAALRDLPWRPAGAHLLGIGPAAARWPEYVSALRVLPKSAWASADAVLHRRLVGREHVDVAGRRRPARPLTIQQDVARAELLEEAWGGIYDPLVGELVDPTEQLPFPSDWMTKQTARQIASAGAAAGMLTRREADLFVEDPTRGRELVLERDEPGAEFWLDWQIEAAWRASVGALGAQIREARAREALLGRRAPTPEQAPDFSQMEVSPKRAANPRVRITAPRLGLVVLVSEFRDSTSVRFFVVDVDSKKTRLLGYLWMWMEWVRSDKPPVYVVQQSAARSGYGPPTYESALEWARRANARVAPGEDVSLEAAAVWKHFFERDDVATEPGPWEPRHELSWLDRTYVLKRPLAGYVDALRRGKAFTRKLAKRDPYVEHTLIEAGFTLFDEFIPS